VRANLRQCYPTFNLGERTLHCGPRQIELASKLCKGRIGCPRSSSGNPRMEAIELQEIFRYGNRAGSRLSNASAHRTRQVCRLRIDTSIQISPNFAANPAGLHLRNCSGGPQASQQVHQHIAAFPNEQTFTTPFAKMTTELINRCQVRDVRSLGARNINLKMHTP
jgi:hypothetical protein